MPSPPPVPEPPEPLVVLEVPQPTPTAVRRPAERRRTETFRMVVVTFVRGVGDRGVTKPT